MSNTFGRLAIVSKILCDWQELDTEHKKFIIRVRNGNGGKYAARPHYVETSEIDEDGNLKEVALWKKAEESGFIECVGSYTWVVTSKYQALESMLLLYVE